MKVNKILLTTAVIASLGATAMAANLDYSIGGNAGNYNAENSLFIGRDHTINVAEAGFKPAQNVAMLGDDNHVHPDAHSVLVTGHDSNVMASYTVTGGMHNTIHQNATYALTAGWQNSNNSEASLVVGHTNVVWKAKNILMFGENNKINEGANNSFVGGESSKVNGKNSFVFGNGAKANLDNTYAIGAGAIAEAENTVAIGNGAVADRTNTVSVGSKNNERIITNIAAGEISATSTDAINGSQFNIVATEVSNNKNNIASNTAVIHTLTNNLNDNINTLNNKINNVQKESNKGIAKASALAGLKFLDYNSKDKWSFAASVGHYRNANTVAVGAAYQPNENTMVHGGITVDDKVAYNLGVSFKTGSQKQVTRHELEEQIRQLENNNIRMQEELNEIRAMLEKK